MMTAWSKGLASRYHEKKEHLPECEPEPKAW